MLKLNAEPIEKGSKEVVVVPIADEAELYYYDWVETNIKKVNDATGGKVGYLHIPDMGVPGLNELAKHYYPQIRKKALIIDVRGNGGGNVSPMIIERLRREIAMITIARNSVPNVDPTGNSLRPDGLPDERVLRIGRRHVPLSFQALQARQADWQTQLGRRGWHPRHLAADGRRLPQSSPNSRATISKARSGSSKDTASIPTSSWTTIRPRNTRALMSS